MRPSFITAIAAIMLIGLAFAQNAPSPDQSQKTEQKSDSDATILLIIPQADDASQAAKVAEPQAQKQKESEPTGPRAGDNKFSQDEAKAKIAEQGFSEISELKKSDDGIWIGKAQREGGSFEVALDFEGNVFFRRATS